ncbi:MAG TPA: hypothetical protein VK063_01290 [Beutenbergiaceae bacterium]|nr:hypothetical protein [Beutenbergiaceae bacterium]
MSDHRRPHRSHDADPSRAGNDWAAQRTEAARIHQERLQARRDAEHRRAEELIAEFIEAARRADLPSTALRVRGYGGRGSARTPLRGWYLRTDASSGLSTEGDFYVLSAPLSVLDRIRGVHPEPSRPPLVLGAGGKDGESLDLTEALERLLPGWRTGR